MVDNEMKDGNDEISATKHLNILDAPLFNANRYDP